MHIQELRTCRDKQRLPMVFNTVFFATVYKIAKIIQKTKTCLYN